MLSIFKRKMSADTLSHVFVSVAKKLLTSSSTPQVTEILSQYVAAGATPESIRFEVAAFEVFNVWAGATRALQKKNIKPTEFEAFQTSLWRQLEEEIPNPPTDKQCLSLKGTTCFQLIEKRVEVLATITVESNGPAVLPSIVEAVCTSVTNGEISMALRLLVQSQYLLNSGSAYDMISATSIIS